MQESIVALQAADVEFTSQITEVNNRVATVNNTVTDINVRVEDLDNRVAVLEFNGIWIKEIKFQRNRNEKSRKILQA